MTAARLSGTPAWRMLLRHIAPNIAPQLITFAMLGMGIVIIIEGALSFLGLGVPAPAPSWGNMIAQRPADAVARRPTLVLLAQPRSCSSPCSRSTSSARPCARAGASDERTAALLPGSGRRLRRALRRCATAAAAACRTPSRVRAEPTELDAGPDAGDHRRVRARARGQLPRADGAAARLRAGHRVGPARRHRAASACTSGEMRRHRGADIAMVFQDPARSLNPTMRIGDPDHRGGPRALRTSTRPPRGSGRSSCCGWSGCRRPSALRRVPAPAVRRHAPAGDDRHRAGRRAAAAHRRRGDHRARRDHPGADHGAAARAAASGSAWRSS